MSSHSSHHQSTATHPYPYQVKESQQSMSTLTSSMGEMKKTFLGRWKSAFQKEAMESLPEQGTLLSSFLPATPPITKALPAIPSIQHDPLLPLMQQTWQGTSYDLAWASGHPGDSPADSTFKLDILWDNINLPYTTFFPRQGNPYQARTPDLEYSTIHWDQPIQITKQSPTPPILTRESTPECYRPELIPGYNSNTGLSQYNRDRREAEWAGSPQKEPFTTLAATPVPRYSPPQSMSTVIHGEAPALLQPCPKRSPIHPQLITLITTPRALYLLSTGKLTEIPEILFHAPLLDLFNHFLKELIEDPHWVITPAGMDYTHYGYEYILKEEARHFTCIAYNMIHQEQSIEVPTRYQWLQVDLSSVATTLEPMNNSLPVPPQWATMLTYAYAVPSYIYPQGYGPPSLQGPSRLFAAAGIHSEGTSGQPQPTNKLQPPGGPPRPPAPPVGPMRWVPPRYPPPPGPPDPPALWVLAPDDQEP
ncbi:hypothetical protein ARMGADRAFT_1084826 [Armillaria gallica]|uniref:Uncharacterized protein n=1 Tax=Armillaria gallica TaxID=47427 RepID=A0A2H3D9R9_ARMGA|nr:hypothetical protein ARMGADRAFT_1084826 [Armillaria gallica]